MRVRYLLWRAVSQMHYRPVTTAYSAVVVIRGSNRQAYGRYGYGYGYDWGRRAAAALPEHGPPAYFWILNAMPKQMPSFACQKRRRVPGSRADTVAGALSQVRSARTAKPQPNHSAAAAPARPPPNGHKQGDWGPGAVDTSSPAELGAALRSAVPHPMQRPGVTAAAPATSLLRAAVGNAEAAAAGMMTHGMGKGSGEGRGRNAGCGTHLGGV